ncbi:hypothetical protein J6590_091153 [Homalodisca vitripennis]|nr:hypothetical protein J6590_091153 [Homalodisca vitripennis]
MSRRSDKKSRSDRVPKSGRPNTSEEAALGNEEAVTEGQRLPAPLGLRGKHLPTQRRRESYESGMTSCKPIQNAPPEAQQATSEEVSFSRNGNYQDDGV